MSARRTGPLALVLLLAACSSSPRLDRGAGRCTHVTTEWELRGAPVCEDVWTCDRPPGGPLDRIGLRRLAPCEVAPGPVVLFLPGMFMNASLPGTDAQHDLRLYLVDAGIPTWGLDYRTHAVPPEASAQDLAALARWDADVFLEDATWTAAFVRTVDRGPLHVAGFSFGAGLAYRMAARRATRPASLVVLDGAASTPFLDDGGGSAIDVGGRRLPYADRQRLLTAVIADPEGASPVAGYPSAGQALADILWTAPSFGGQGGLSAARRGVSDVEDVARLLASYDRWWPRAALGGKGGAPDAPLPVLAFASTNMGPEWVRRVRESAERFGGTGAQVRELRGYGHLDVLVGRRAAHDVFEPVRVWLLRE